MSTAFGELIRAHPEAALRREWLEPDGLGGFASGTISGVRTRRYHSLLLTATTPPTGRFVLVNGFDAWVETPRGQFALSSQRYAPGITHPNGASRIERFATEPWPRWLLCLEDGIRIEQQIVAQHGVPVVALSWKLCEPRADVALAVRPFLSGRDYHSLHHENQGFRFAPEGSDRRLVWRTYPGVPAIVMLHNGAYQHAPDWYRNFQYEAERERGLDFTEDLAAPGIFRWKLSAGEAVWILGAQDADAAPILSDGSPLAYLRAVRRTERQRRTFPSRLHRAADAYLVRRGDGRTIVAGYPWFTDWGRDTFIALRGLCLASGNLDTARAILLEWAATVSEGMVPNRFPDSGETAEFNAVDASLWYIVAVHDFFAALRRTRRPLPPGDQQTLQGAAEAILCGYTRGTRHRIGLDEDGLLAAGEAGVQLTWMDAKVGDWVVTPRIGKPVEVQALWLNALRIASRFNAAWHEPFTRGCAAFAARFWNANDGYLHDVVDPEHVKGAADSCFRPNQIFAVGGLPFAILNGERARRVVDLVEMRLLTPLGLRSLAPENPAYTPHYHGGVRERDAAYHQGTVWPWLLGPFVEAWVRVRGGTPAAKHEARLRFLEPLLAHLDDSGVGHLSEVADAEPPFSPGGCPFQAWSVGEALRLDQIVLS